MKSLDQKLSHSKKVVVITGCSSGIGLALAQGLPDKGYQVIATVRNKSDREHLEQQGLITLLLDLADSHSIDSAWHQILDIAGENLWGLINNGAYGQPGAVEDLSRYCLRSQFETNVFGTQELTNLCLKEFRRFNQGRIIQISSILGRICMANRGAYNASKYALEALSDTLRLELHDSDIHVSLIEPGPIESRFRANALKAFKTHIDAENSWHQAHYASVIKRLSNSGNTPFTLPASAIVKPTSHALSSNRPRARYPVTVPTYVLPNIKRFLPDRMMDWILRKSGDQPGK